MFLPAAVQPGASRPMSRPPTPGHRRFLRRQRSAFGRRQHPGGGRLGEDSSATGIGGDKTDNSASTSGAVYVFTRSGSTWSQQAYVKASNTGPQYDRLRPQRSAFGRRQHPGGAGARSLRTAMPLASTATRPTTRLGPIAARYTSTN
jgi:hypothetical protein